MNIYIPAVCGIGLDSKLRVSLSDNDLEGGIRLEHTISLGSLLSIFSGVQLNGDDVNRVLLFFLSVFAIAVIDANFFTIM